MCVDYNSNRESMVKMIGSWFIAWKPQKLDIVQLNICSTGFVCIREFCMCAFQVYLHANEKCKCNCKQIKVQLIYYSADWKSAYGHENANNHIWSSACMLTEQCEKERKIDGQTKKSLSPVGNANCEIHFAIFAKSFDSKGHFKFIDKYGFQLDFCFMVFPIEFECT